MRVFVTGATGFVGSAVVQELLRSGHKVLGLARSDANAQALIAAGAEPHRGHLEDLSSLRSGAATTDAVIHCAFIHDFSQFAANCEIDRHAIAALGAGVAGSQRPILITSGIGAVLTPGRPSTEEDAANAPVPRVASEQAAAGLVDRGLNVSVVRLPPSVHGEGDHAFIPMIIKIAREKGVSAHIGAGLNRWPAVHRLDAAVLYRLAIEHAKPGLRYHAIGDEGVPTREIAATIARRLNLSTTSITPDQADGHFGFLAHFLAADIPSTATLTRQHLNWQPTQPGLLEDLNQPHYFPA